MTTNDAFPEFLRAMGEGSDCAAASGDVIDEFAGRLPRNLLEHWKARGWCAHGDGIFWTVDPRPFDGLVKLWLKDSELEGRDSYHAVARSAFGELIVWGERSGKVTINCPANFVLAAAVPKDAALAMESFFAMADQHAYDMDDEDGEGLFERARAKLGRLSRNEMYGFEPALVAGGVARIERLRKVQLLPHLTILRQLAAPKFHSRPRA